MPRGGRRRAAQAAGRAAENDRLSLKMVLLLSGLTLKVPVALYLFSKIVLFQGLLLLSAEDSAFYALVVSVIGLHVMVCGFVLLMFPVDSSPPPWERKY